MKEDVSEKLKERSSMPPRKKHSYMVREGLLGGESHQGGH